MIVYRIAKSNRIRDLTGAGAEKYGGRWNPAGFPLIYTASNSSLAILEHLVHLDIDLLTNEFKLAEIHIEGKFSMKRMTESDLPGNWKLYPAPDSLKIIGMNWLKSMKTLALSVPSAVNPLQNNILINPLHKEISKISIMKVYSIQFDPRLSKKL